MCGLFAGTIVAFYLGLFSLAPWVIAVYPGILSLRGVIGGLLSGHMSTGLHVGTVRPRFFGNTKSFYLLFQAIVALTLETSVIMGLVAVLFGNLFWAVGMTDMFAILGVITATMALSLVIISPLTMTVSFLSFKHGLDPDIILYPIESTVSDVLITICYVSVLSLFFLFGLVGRYLIGFLSLILLISTMYFSFKNAKEKEFIKTIRESFSTLLFVAFIVNVTGSFLRKISEVIGGRREIYTVYPALIDTIGDVGAVVGSTATTKLALGTLRPSLSAIRNHNAEVFGAWTASITMFIVYSAMALLIQGMFLWRTFLSFAFVLLLSNLIAASGIIVVAYTVGILTFQKGLDPDNFVIPIESSLADSITTISLLAALTLIG